jgi:hypothetical protein
MADRSGSHAKYMTGGDVHVRSLPPEDALGTALWLLGFGLWPVAISPPGDSGWASPGKSPIGKGWGIKRPSAGTLKRTFARHRRAGVGVLLGPAGGVVDLETDEPEAAAAELRRLFPEGLAETMGWRSARGDHRLFAWDDRLDGLAPTSVVALGGGALELRLGGRDKQVASVCPPSLTAEGTPRVWSGCWRVAPFPAALLSALVEPRGPVGQVTSRNALRDRPLEFRVAKRGGRYGAAALARESDLVRGAQPGGRNRTLNRAAFSLGQLVAGGAIDRMVVERALLDAALECGLGTREAEATIRSGLEAGLEHPRPNRG